jgi:hypothetical protein
VVAAVTTGLFLWVVTRVVSSGVTPEPTPYSTFKSMVEHQQVASLVSNKAQGDLVTFVTTDGHYHTTRFPAYTDQSLETVLESRGVVINDPKMAIAPWDIVSSAAPFALFGAVMAGFVFIALIGILTQPPRGPGFPIPAAPLAALIQAFLSLVAAAFLLSVLAGGSAAAGRLMPIVEGFTLSWLLALGVVQTAVAIAWVMSEYKVDRRVVAAANFIVIFGIGLAAVSTAGIIVTPLYESETSPQTAALIWLLMAAPFVVSLWLGRRWRTKTGEAGIYWLNNPALGGVVIVTVAYLLVSAFLTDSALRSHLGAAILAMELAQLGLAGLFAGYSASLPSTQRRTPAH